MNRQLKSVNQLFNIHFDSPLVWSVHNSGEPIYFFHYSLSFMFERLTYFGISLLK